jgi:hypothetical protein
VKRVGPTADPVAGRAVESGVAVSCQVSPIRSGALLTARAFEWRGVTLRYPARSRSGQRDEDGTVVFAMSQAQVRVSDWGCSCPLWLPAGAGAAREADAAVRRERLQHCKLALRLGVAEGFLLDAHDVPAVLREVLCLHVVKAGAEYWATWGGVARARLAEGRGAAQDARQARSAHGGR